MVKGIKKRLSIIMSIMLMITSVSLAPVEANASVTNTQISAYQSKLYDIHNNPTNYLGSSATTSSAESSTFAVADINEDGVDDLLVRLSIGVMASNHFRVWTADGSGKLTELSNANSLGSYCDFYNNGYVVSRASHNQGYGQTIWPHSVYHYNSSTKKWEQVYTAYCIDKDYSSTGNPYKAADDTDNDGVIYYINGKASTKAVYDSYVNKYIPEKNKKNITWLKLSNSNISSLKSSQTATPQITSLTSDETGIKIQWSAVSGAAAYRVYYKTSSGSWKRFNTDVKTTSRYDTGVSYGRKETYTVRALDNSGNLISDYNHSGWSATYGVASPQITSLTSNENGINIKWSAVTGASTYRVYYKTSSGGWKRFASDVKGTTKLDSGVVYGRAETYTVRAVNKKGDVMSGYKSAGWSTTYGVATPQITSLTSDENGINIKWSAVTGASTYRVYYKTSSGSWKRFASDVKGTTKLDTGVNYGRAETYTVRAVNKKGDVMSGYKSAGWSTTYSVATPQITSLKNTSNGIQITWNKISGVSTYRVYYKTSAGAWKRFNTDTKGTTRMDTGVVNGRAETYTVRALDTKGNPISGYNTSGWTITYSNGSSSSSGEYQLNSYELEVVDLINDIRTENGLSKLSVNKELSRVARIKAQDMYQNNYFDHNSPTYGSPFEMIQSYGISYNAAGENIAYGSATPQGVVNSWMNSAGHRANILSSDFTQIGMGYVSGNWSQMFIG